MDFKNARPNKKGQYRIYGMFLNLTPRIWIGVSDDFPLKEDSILKLKDSSGFTTEALASEEGLMFDTILSPHK